MKILVDMNLSPDWAAFLAKQGIEAVHWVQVGARDAADIDLMKWAADNEHIVFTADLDFGAILAATQRTKPSVVQVRGELLSPRIIGPAVLKAIRQARKELIEGALVSVDTARSRIRILPLISS
jgi:predicted nuclease of predicted toxin-antitoxin system